MLGQPEGFVIKLLLGGGFLVLLILLIWGPLLLIALANTQNVSNPPVEVSIQLTVEMCMGNFSHCYQSVLQMILLKSYRKQNTID